MTVGQVLFPAGFAAIPGRPPTGVWSHLAGVVPEVMTAARSASRVLFDVTDLMWLIAKGHHPTGIPRVVAECLVPLIENVPNLVPVFFSRITRTFCQIDGRRMAVRDIDYVKKVSPAPKDHLRRLYAYFGVLLTKPLPLLAPPPSLVDQHVPEPLPDEFRDLSVTGRL